MSVESSGLWETLESTEDRLRFVHKGCTCMLVYKSLGYLSPSSRDRPIRLVLRDTMA